MRNAFIKSLTELAKKNKRIILITGDLGYSVLDEFSKKFPKQFLNAGISEQNMTGLAAGMAMEGKIPLIYSIIPFVTMRNFEQIRDDIVYQNLNVKIVGVGTGFSYGPYGYTHHPLEDIAVMRTLPNMTIFSPADPFETKFVTSQAFKLKTPVYIRLGKVGEPVLHNSTDILTFGKVSILKSGDDIAILTTGNIAQMALKVSNLLSKDKISSSVISVHTLKPFDKNFIPLLAKKIKAIFTIEEHSIMGGLGSIVSEIVAESNKKIIFKRFGTPDKITHFIGSQEFMRKKHGLSAENIAKEILKVL